ncbi:hypothetical protein M8818_001018 [Zalaria obscura]|uniref:Uncharacterized protein n=1 Tax=Zalaria obscura TaxID=2024903 RepID=A0ACC3SLX4_9PEZI
MFPPIAPGRSEEDYDRYGYPRARDYTSVFLPNIPRGPPPYNDPFGSTGGSDWLARGNDCNGHCRQKRLLAVSCTFIDCCSAEGQPLSRPAERICTTSLPATIRYARVLHSGAQKLPLASAQTVDGLGTKSVSVVAPARRAAWLALR